MVIDISDRTFRTILNDPRLFLPIRWDGIDFSDTLSCLLNYYINKLEALQIEEPYNSKVAKVDIKEIKKVSGLLIKAVNHYLNGFPAKAYASLKKCMDKLTIQPLKIYQKSILDNSSYSDDLDLFRIVSVDDNKQYERSRVFHTPYNLRSKVSTCRYSIAGYPSLYLGTSLELCCEELHINPIKDLAIASQFKLERSFDFTNTNIQVIELGIKPQDFIKENNSNEIHYRHISYDLLQRRDVKSAYLLWYPLIATCSYIRVNKKDPFSAEYIIPQLLMQWVRDEIGSQKNEEYENLIGIRYFSCASQKSSEMGFNYVFPTSGKCSPKNPLYCSVLANSFRLTKPFYINDYRNISECEYNIKNTNDIDYI